MFEQRPTCAVLTENKASYSVTCSDGLVGWMDFPTLRNGFIYIIIYFFNLKQTCFQHTNRGNVFFNYHILLTEL